MTAARRKARAAGRSRPAISARRPKRRAVLVVVGTRPEAIKMAPVIMALRRSPTLRPLLLSTGQHRDMLDQALAAFRLRPDLDLDVMKADQSLEDLTARLIPPLTAAFRRLKPAAALVQGDTTTTVAAALAAFYAGVPCGHVEAGLRTYDPTSPFPEEMNRRLTDHLCRWNYAPTDRAARQLRAEGIAASRIKVTGNTVVDALLWMRDNAPPAWPGTVPLFEPDRRIILVTAHRRESFGEPMRRLFGGLRKIVAAFGEVEVIYPVHLNPNVRRAARAVLAGVPRIHLVEPVGYAEMVTLLDRCHLVLTDSGGIQEEAPTLGKPVLVMREATERPEGLERGTSALVGTDPERLVAACRRLLAGGAAYRRMAGLRNPFGDGRAAGRIVRHLEKALAAG